jgi:5-methylcytosine-specific restriction endonuclease McrA
MGKPTASWRGDTKSSTERGYNHQWSKARKLFLSANPLCVMCEASGVIEPAQVVDHKTPHRGDQKLFWDMNNWQALCKRCHDSDKQMWEKSKQERTKFTPDGKVIW